METSEPVRISAAALYKAAPLLVPAYGAVLSLIYLQFYWGLFDVNVFSYLSAADLALAAMYGLLPLLIALPVGIWAGLGSGGPMRASTSKIRSYFKGALFFGVMALYVYHWRPAIGLAASVVLLAIALKPIVRTLREIATSRAASLAMFAALTTPVFVAGAATTSALVVSLDGSHAVVEVSGPALAGAGDLEVRHLGHVGDYDFFYVPETRSVLRVQSASIEQIRFVRNRVRPRNDSTSIDPGAGESGRARSMGGR